jgi:hypothetical protein
MVGAVLSGTTAMGYEYQFMCQSKDLDPRLEISGTFIQNDGMTGLGQVVIKQGAQEGDLYSDVQFYRGST